MDLSKILKDSVDAESWKLDNDGEDADGMEISSDPLPPRTTPRPHHCQPVRKCTSAGVPSRPPRSSITVIQAASASVNRVTWSVTQSLVEKARTKLSSKARRTKIRVQKAQAGHGGLNYKLKPRTNRDRLLDSVTTSISAHALPHNRTGYTGKRDLPVEHDGHIWTRDELLAEGFRFVDWDGRYVFYCLKLI